MPELKRILVPVDFSEGSSGALAYAGFLAKQLGASVDVLHVVELPSFLGGDAPVRPVGSMPRTVAELAVAQASDDLERFMMKHPCRRDLAISRRLELGEPASVIVRAAEGYDLVVMGSRGRTGLLHLLMGSIAEKVVRLSRCPVLVIRGGVSELP